ncbi:MAG TPA: lysozyme inhibitor LprI family protein [Trinickia sp.]|jgi:uncharacterized protein|nr:lysozyme inhibitor LprI family protein [Trinickia sp.]
MNRTVSSAALAVFIALAAGAAFAQTASFDCAAADTPAERKICATPRLGELDVRMATYYQILQDARPAGGGMAYREFRDALKAEQADWQHKTRDVCGAQAKCLENAYRTRIDTLRDVARERLQLTFEAPGNEAGAQTSASLIDYRNSTYWIDDQAVKLVGGQRVQAAAPGSATKDVTRVAESPKAAQGKLGGQPAVAFFLVDAPGGSGTFYYAAAALGGRGTHAALLGDRITPQSIAIDRGEIVVTYLDRKSDDPMFVPPSVKVMRRFSLSGDRLRERGASQSGH